MRTLCYLLLILFASSASANPPIPADEPGAGMPANDEQIPLWIGYSEHAAQEVILQRQQVDYFEQPGGVLVLRATYTATLWMDAGLGNVDVTVEYWKDYLRILDDGSIEWLIDKHAESVEATPAILSAEITASNGAGFCTATNCGGFNWGELDMWWGLTADGTADFQVYNHWETTPFVPNSFGQWVLPESVTIEMSQ